MCTCYVRLHNTVALSVVAKLLTLHDQQSAHQIHLLVRGWGQGIICVYVLVRPNIPMDEYNVI